MIIYLDQNKWLDLARAIIKPKKFPKYVPVASAIQSKSDSGAWQFPISLIHLMETLKRRDIGSRERLAEVMASISKSKSILPFTHVEDDEFFKSFANLHAPHKEVKVSPILDHIFGAVGSGMVQVEVDKDVPEHIKTEIHTFFNKLAHDPNIFHLLMSHLDDADSELITEIYKDEEDSKQEFEQLKLKFQKTPKQYAYKAFLIDSFLSRFMTVNKRLQQIFNKSNENIIPASLLADQDKCLNLLESIPSLDVRIKLMYEVFKNPKKEVHEHDDRDIAFLATAIPYCDVVITERTWKHHAKVQKLDIKYSTKIESDLDFLMTL